MPLEPNVLKTFKFKWIDGEGNETGFLKKRGEFNGETLKLDDVEVLVDGIAVLRFETSSLPWCCRTCPMKRIQSMILFKR